MKKYLFILIFCAGCASKATRVSQYCDANWQGRFNSWQDCYDRRMQVQSPLAAGLKGFSDGFNANRSQQKTPARATSCVTTGQPGLYTTNCN